MIASSVAKLTIKHRVVQTHKPCHYIADCKEVKKGDSNTIFLIVILIISTNCKL